MTSAPILHLDLDAFYASVEQRADPSLMGRPVVVGGLGPRGVVAAASYEARRFGVHSAIPMARARRLCPDAVFVAPRFDAYRDASRVVMAILRDVTPFVEPLAADEAFLDVTGATRIHGSPPEIGAALRARIRRETGLAASVGVATTKLCAKLASDLAKPDGLLVVEPGQELALLHPLPVERLWGVGPATRRRLARFGVRTVGELAALPEDTLVGALGPAAGRALHALAWNRDDRVVESEREAKTIGHEETFATDLTHRPTLEREVLRMAERVTARLRATAKTARTVQLKVRYGDFRTITRSRTLAEPTDRAVDVVATARALLERLELGDGVRLVGVSVQQLLDTPSSVRGGEAAVQQVLPLEPGGPPMDAALDQVRARFGDRAVGPARLAEQA